MYSCEPATIKRAQISVQGVVQGVGFRPFVYQLAAAQNLKGWVCNTSGAVAIEVEGAEEKLTSFAQQIEMQAPPLAVIEHLSCHIVEAVGYQAFEIKESRAEHGKYQRISPDIATCPQCLQELFDPRDRRYAYPFTNCTNCGPRFTIINDIPYDRPETTMRVFTMCPACQAEYDNPLDRRFHAQPNCCPVCGPHVLLTERAGSAVASTISIPAAAALLREGNIVAVKGLGGFLLACDATNAQAVRTLRERKHRPWKPFAVMMATVDDVKRHCLVSPEEETLLSSIRAPIVLLKRNEKGLLAAGVAPNLHYLGVMLPYTPLHHLLLRAVSLPLVMTSGNISEEPIAKDNKEGLQRLAGIADYFLLHNRDIQIQFDDSVTMVEDGVARVLRRARSYAPDPIHLTFTAQQVLACGAELKNTFCITKDQYAFVSQHIGDLENLESLTHFEHALGHYKHLFRLDPRIIAHDKHPDYLSTRYAREIQENSPDLVLVPVQHHHAHIVSCMTENAVQPPVIGVAFDGTGYGDDGAMWGGEFLLVNYDRYERLGHLEYVPMPGGEAAIRKPYRMAVSYLLTLLGGDALERWTGCRETIGKQELELLRQQITRRINCPPTSSSGRLFDAVSALLSVCTSSDYEGQAAIELEMAAGEKRRPQKIYPFDIVDQQGRKIVRIGGILEGVLEDRALGTAVGEISLSFHHTMAHVIARMCRLLSCETGIGRVALSGGVFQNRLFLGIVRQYLQDSQLEVITHKEVPCNDGGISLGQAVIAHFIVAGRQHESRFAEGRQQ